MNEKKLLCLIGQGKTEYMDEIARTYYDDVYRFCCFQTGDREWAYDLTQETFLRFIRYADHYGGGNLKGYLLTVAMNVCRDGWKLRKRQGERELADEDARDYPISRVEDRLLLQKALMQLPDFQREAIVLHYCYNFKYREIGRMTGVGTATVKSRIRQGLEKLKELLK